MKNIW